MVVAHVHQALDQVREIRRRVIERQLFRGYSGVARGFGGILALFGAALMSLPFYPQTAQAHVFGWGAVCVFSALINMSALAVWHLRQKKEGAQIDELRPVIDLFGPFVVAGILTFAMIQANAHDYLFGIWMGIFGLMNISSRHALPGGVWHLGWYYIACSAFYFFAMPVQSFLNPWPMGIAFFVGELAGGMILHNVRTKEVQ